MRLDQLTENDINTFIATGKVKKGENNVLLNVDDTPLTMDVALTLLPVERAEELRKTGENEDSDEEAKKNWLVRAGLATWNGTKFVLKTTGQELTPDLVQTTLDQALGRIGTGKLEGQEPPESAARRQQIAELAQRTAEQRSEAARAGAIAERPEEIQAARDIELAGRSAGEQARAQLGGAAGAGAAALAGAQAAETARAQVTPTAIREARARRDVFEQKEVDRRALAQATQEAQRTEQQRLAIEQQKYRDMLTRNRQIQEYHRRGQAAADLENRRRRRQSNAQADKDKEQPPTRQTDQTEKIEKIEPPTPQQPVVMTPEKIRDVQGDLELMFQKGDKFPQGVSPDRLRTLFDSQGIKYTEADIKNLYDWSAYIEERYNRDTREMRSGYDTRYGRDQRGTFITGDGRLQVPSAPTNPQIRNQGEHPGVSDARVKDVVSDEDLKIIKKVNIRWY